MCVLMRKEIKYQYYMCCLLNNICLYLQLLRKNSRLCDNEQQIKYEIAKNYCYRKCDVRRLLVKNKNLEKAIGLKVLSGNNI